MDQQRDEVNGGAVPPAQREQADEENAGGGGEMTTTIAAEMDLQQDEDVAPSPAAKTPVKKHKRRGMRNELRQLNTDKSKWDRRDESRRATKVLGGTLKVEPRSKEDERVQQEEEDEEEEEEKPAHKAKKTVSTQGTTAKKGQRGTRHKATVKKEEKEEKEEEEEDDDEVVDVVGEDSPQTVIGIKQEERDDEAKPARTGATAKRVARRTQRASKANGATNTATENESEAAVDMDVDAEPRVPAPEPETPRRRVARRRGQPVAVVASASDGEAREEMDNEEGHEELQARKRKRQSDDDHGDDGGEREEEEMTATVSSSSSSTVSTPRPAPTKKRRMRAEVRAIQLAKAKEEERAKRRENGFGVALIKASKDDGGKAEEDEEEDEAVVRRDTKKPSASKKQTNAKRAGKEDEAAVKRETKKANAKLQKEEEEEDERSEDKNKKRKRTSLTKACEEGKRWAERPVPRSPVGIGRARNRRPPIPFASPPPSPISPRRESRKNHATKKAKPTGKKRGARDVEEDEEEEQEEEEEVEEEEEGERKRKSSSKKTKKTSKEKKKAKESATKKGKKEKKRPLKRPRISKEEQEEQEEEREEEQVEEEEEELEPQKRRQVKAIKGRLHKSATAEDKLGRSKRRTEADEDQDEDDEVKSGDEGGGYQLARTLRCHSIIDNDRDDEGPNVYAIAFHPQHDHVIATAGGDSVCVYDCRDSKLLKKYKQPPQAGEESFYALAWTTLPYRSRRGDFSMPVIAAGGKQGDIKLIDVDSAQLFAVLQVPAVPGMPAGTLREVQHITFSPAQPWLMFSGHANGSILVWSITAPKQGAQSRHVYDLSVSPNGEEVISGSSDETICRWKLPSGFDAKATLAGEHIVLPAQSKWDKVFEEVHEVDMAQFVTDKIMVCKNVANPFIVLLDMEYDPPRELARLEWSLKEYNPEQNLPVFIKGKVTHPAAGEDQLLLLGTGDGRVNLYNLSSVLQQQQKKKTSSNSEIDNAKPHSRELGLYTQRSKGEGRPIYGVARSRDGRYLAAGGCDNLVYIWHRQP